MSSSVLRVPWRPLCPTRVMRVASALLQKTYSNNGSFKLPLAMKMRTIPTPYATILSSNSCLIVCPRPVPLASQPTISRFENRVSRTELYRMALVLMDQFIASYDSPEVIVLDVDDTEDRAHGEQEHIRYDGYYGGYCFMPCHLYEGLSGRLITTILKAKRFSGAQMLAVLKRVVKRLRHAWPDTWVILRGDSHFAYPEVMAWLEAQPQLSYVIGLTSNTGFQALAPEKVRLADNDGLMPRDESEGVFPESTFSGKIFIIQHVFSII